MFGIIVAELPRSQSLNNLVINEVKQERKSCYYLDGSQHIVFVLKVGKVRPGWQSEQLLSVNFDSNLPKSDVMNAQLIIQHRYHVFKYYKIIKVVSFPGELSVNPSKQSLEKHYIYDLFSCTNKVASEKESERENIT